MLGLYSGAYRATRHALARVLRATSTDPDLLGKKAEAGPVAEAAEPATPADGQVLCVCPATGKQTGMCFGGFECDRDTLQYRCPARHLGIDCNGIDQCPVAKALRIPLVEDRRVFTPVARSSYVWKDYYDQRSESRMDETGWVF